MPRRVGYKAIYLLRRRRSRQARFGVPDLGISNLDDA